MNNQTTYNGQDKGITQSKDGEGSKSTKDGKDGKRVRKNIRTFRYLEKKSKITNMYLRGVPQHEIAETVGTNRKAVERILYRVRNEWRRTAAADIALQREKELAKLDLQEKELWEAWEKSKQKVEVLHVRRRVNSKPGEKGDSVDTGTETVEEKTVREAVGDVRIMEQIRKVCEFRAKILGLTQEVNFNSFNFINWDELPNVFLQEVPNKAEQEILKLEGEGGSQDNYQGEGGSQDNYQGEGGSQDSAQDTIVIESYSDGR